MDYETEEQQVEALKAWWAENGRAVVTGVVLGAVAIGGWGWWRNHSEQQAVAASDAFSQTLSAVESAESADVYALSEGLRDGHDGSLYSAYAALAAARVAVENDELDRAVEELRWASENAVQEDVQLIARIRLARVLGATDSVEEALSTLPSDYPEPFTGLIEEARGDLLLQSGDPDGARDAYEKAQVGDHVVDPSSLGMKLDDLAIANEES